jgi:hypothetical protein
MFPPIHAKYTPVVQMTFCVVWANLTEECNRPPDMPHTIYYGGVGPQNTWDTSLVLTNFTVVPA